MEDSTAAAAQDIPIRVVHADERVVALDKPAGLLSVPGLGPAGAHNLWAQAEARWPGLRIVHRLDQATSGLMLFARDAATQRSLSIAFARREVDKHYVAVVHGAPAQASGCIDLPLGADWPNRPRQRVDLEQGKASVTHWRILERQGAAARLELQPLTGRSHQLRVHLAAIGHPIVGDRLYGPADDRAGRLMLHATSLRFTHPGTGQPVWLHSRAPF